MKKLSCKKIVWLVALLLVLAFSAHVVCCMVMDVRSKDYRDADYNLVWGDTGREVDKEVLAIFYLIRGELYYRIKGVPADKYIACMYHVPGIGTYSRPIVMARKDYEPVYSFDVSTAVLSWGKYYERFSEEDWDHPAKSMMGREITGIDADTAKGLADIILAQEREYFDKPDDWYLESEYVRNGDGSELMICFTLEEYKGLFWMAPIVSYRGEYFMKICIERRDFNEAYLPCGEALNELIRSKCMS